ITLTNKTNLLIKTNLLMKAERGESIATAGTLELTFFSPGQNEFRGRVLREYLIAGRGNLRQKYYMGWQEFEQENRGPNFKQKYLTICRKGRNGTRRKIQKVFRMTGAYVII